MRCPLLPFVAVAFLAATVPAQLTFRAVNDAGFAYTDKAGQTVVKNYAKGTSFVRSTGLYAYPKGGYMNAKVQHGWANRWGVETTCRLVGSYGFKGGRTTGATSGVAGAQKFELGITTTKPTLVIVNLSFLVNVYGGNTKADLKVTGNGINESRSWTKKGLHKDTKSIQFNLNGTTKLLLEVASTCTPTSTSSLGYDGYLSALTVDVNLNAAGEFKTYGTACGNAVMRGSGTPTGGKNYKVHVDKAPANAPLWFILGLSNTKYGLLKLPLPLDYMGATGCFLSAEPLVLIPKRADAQGHAEMEFYLSTYSRGTTHYMQWFVDDPKANSAGFTMTKGAALTY